MSILCYFIHLHYLIEVNNVLLHNIHLKVIRAICRLKFYIRKQSNYYKFYKVKKNSI